MDKPECCACVAKDKEIAELNEHVEFMRKQIARLKKAVSDLENIFATKPKPK
jgi:chaperonin cofactor prefoldin